VTEGIKVPFLILKKEIELLYSGVRKVALGVETGQRKRREGRTKKQTIERLEQVPGGGSRQGDEENEEVHSSKGFGRGGGSQLADRRND